MCYSASITNHNDLFYATFYRDLSMGYFKTTLTGLLMVVVQHKKNRKEWKAKDNHNDLNIGLIVNLF